MEYDYSNELEHVAQPANPSDRKDADSIIVMDYEALWLSKQLRDYASYRAPTSERACIAEAYSDYINEKVREYGESATHLYAHTTVAKKVLQDTIPSNDATNSMTGIVRELNIQLEKFDAV